MALGDTDLETKIANQDIDDMQDKREYKITIGIRSYWITEEEKDLYLADSKNPNIDHVALRGGLMILPVKFQDIVHRSVIEDSEKIEGGRWQCDAGEWHAVGAECYCNSEVIELDDRTVRIQEKTDKQLPEPQRENAPRATSYQLAGSLKSF